MYSEPLRRHDVATHQTRRGGPAQKAQRHVEVDEARPHGKHHDDGEKQEREAGEHLDGKGDDSVDLAAKVAGQNARSESDEKGDGLGDHADGQADAAAVDDAGEDVSAVLVSTEDVAPPGFWNMLVICWASGS